MLGNSMALGHGRWVFVACLGLLGVACGGDDDDDAAGGTSGISAATQASYEGIYTLSRLTENEAGCDAEGPSKTVGDQQFVLVGAAAFGVSYLELASCGETAACADVVESIRHPSIILADYSLILSIENDADHIAGLSATNGYSENGQCVSREYDDHELTRTGADIRVETRYTPLPDAPSENDSCPVKPLQLRDEAMNVPCGKLRVIEGTKTGPLPG